MKIIQILTALFILLAMDLRTIQGAESSLPSTSWRICADIDGSDRLSISEREVLWVHRHWDWPNRVRINGVDWRPRHSPVLAEDSRRTLITEPIDFSSARMSVHQGRDTVVLEAFKDHVLIHFADSPNGRSQYDLTITFDTLGRKQFSSPEHREDSSRAGLIGMAYVQQERANVVFRYGNGRVFAPSLLEGTVVPEGKTIDGVQINLSGVLVLSKELTVRVRHAGGSSTRGYATLAIDGKFIETLGDDREKVSERVFELAAGEHLVEWKLSGGDIGHCLLEFADAATGTPLSLFHTREQLASLDMGSTIELIDVQSEQSDWPIPQEW